MMNRSTLLGWSVLASLLAGACDGPAPASTPAEAEAFDTSYPPGAPAVSGLPALHAFTVEYLEAGLTEFREESTDFYGNREYVVDAGTYVVIYGPDNVTERGKYLNVWQQVDGEWKIRTNMWNTDAPAPTPS